MFGERVSPGPTNQRSFLVFLVAGGQMLLKQHLLIHLNCLLSVSLPISVFFTHSLHVVLRKGQGTVSKRRGLIAYVRTMTSTANFWAQIIFDPYRRPLTLTFLLVSTRGLFQDVMFDRLHNSTLSEDASEVYSATASLRHREGKLCGLQLISNIIDMNKFILILLT